MYDTAYIVESLGVYINITCTKVWLNVNLK